MILKQSIGAGANPWVGIMELGGADPGGGIVDPLEFCKNAYGLDR